MKLSKFGYKCDIFISSSFRVNVAYIRFYEELNDFLPPSKRKVLRPVYFNETPSVKSIIESEGIPHPEVDLILINSESVPFHEKVRNGDHISVYPVFESFDISSVNMIRLKPLREPKFVLDVHLGKLTRYLRMLGFDSVYDQGYKDEELVSISALEKRSILTRDRKLLMRKQVERGYWIRSEMIIEQVSEVIQRFDLEDSIRLFSLCTLCNGYLRPADEKTVMLSFPAHEFFPGTMFYCCDRCHHIYWKGSHSERFERSVMEKIMNKPGI
jgi:uncharacterized protein with PIN domain